MPGFQKPDLSTLGGGQHGKVEAQGYNNTMVGSQNAMNRKKLRKAFRTNTLVLHDNTTMHSKAGPFRTAFHLGDPLGRKNVSCGGANQVHSTTSNVCNHRLADSVPNSGCSVVVNGLTTTDVPLESGNSKFVADSSLYTQFRHLQSVNRTYNDSTYGGDEYNSNAQALSRVRRG